MNIAVVYFSRTGNTRRVAESIAEAVKAPLLPIATVQPSSIEAYDLIIVGTPVEGASPAKETTAFLDSMNKVQGKKAIVFCTCKLFGNSRTNNNMEKKLKSKGYEVILKTSKKGMSPEDNKTDFSELVSEIKKKVDELK
jgi:flavodoxin